MRELKARVRTSGISPRAHRSARVCAGARFLEHLSWFRHDGQRFWEGCEFVFRVRVRVNDFYVLGLCEREGASVSMRPVYMLVHNSAYPTSKNLEALGFPKFITLPHTHTGLHIKLV